MPQFIVYSDPDTMDGESLDYSICEVLQHHLADQEPPEEDPIPDDIDMGMGLSFDLFGLGQPVNEPEVQEEQNQEAQYDN